MNKERADNLRRQAEDHLAAREGQIESLEQADLKKLAHELAVHQVELEIQNEELRRAREEAEESRDRYLDLFDFAPVGYFMLDEHNRIVEANLTGCRLLNIARSNIMKKSFAKFLHPDEIDRFYFHRKKALESGLPQTTELSMQKADGTPFYAQIESLKVGEERLRLAIIDVTERKRTEARLAQQKIQLEATYKELEAFSYSVSHDLKAPLRALDGFSEMVLEDYNDKLDATGKDYLQRIREASQTMARLIDDILKLSQVSRSEVDFEEVNLSQLAGSIADELRVNQPERSVELIIAPGIIVKGDRQLLQILLRNLLENAWKYTGKCSQARIKLGATQQDGKAVYFMKDNGVGFDMHYADKLFTPFRRLHSSKEYPGTGIGLALAQRIVRRHGGSIWAEAKINQGATFYFMLD